MRRGLVLAATVLLAAIPAYAAGSAGKAPESVTVTGTRSHQVIQDFVRKFTVPTRVAGKITRWGEGICPQTVGLRPSAVKFVNDRLRAVAEDVGAPVDRRPNCVVNIEIAFTTTPQAMIDNVRERRPELLGYADNGEKAAALAKVVRPIQAWYFTQTRDIRGNVYPDIGPRTGAGLEIPCGASGIDNVCLLPDAIAANSSGSRLGDGIRSEFHHVIVVVDPTKLTDYSVGQLADYITLMALSQVATPDACQPIASITNLLAPGCAQTPDAISATDLAYLRGLYRMHAGMDWRIQRHEIVSEIEQEAGGR
jgi:hypothetical protein